MYEFKVLMFVKIVITTLDPNAFLLFSMNVPWGEFLNSGMFIISMLLKFLSPIANISMSLIDDHRSVFSKILRYLDKFKVLGPDCIADISIRLNCCCNFLS